MPSVAQTTAFFGLRPVAKALGLLVGIIPTLGIGMPFIAAMLRTMRYRRGASASLTIFTRYDRSTILLEKK